MDATTAWFIMGFIVFVSLGHTSQYGEWRNISVSRLRYSANHNAPDSWPIRAHLVSGVMSFVKNDVFKKGAA